MDEPTVGLDEDCRERFLESLLRFKENRITIFSTHLAEEANNCGDKVAFIRNGQLIYFDTPKSLKDEYGN